MEKRDHMAKQNQVIEINSPAFFALINEVLERLGHRQAEVDQWINTEEAMRILNIKSKSTLQKLRDEGKIRFSQPAKKILLFDRYSLLDYIGKHAQATF